jgi:hypothetical protein
LQMRSQSSCKFVVMVRRVLFFVVYRVCVSSFVIRWCYELRVVSR